MVGINVPSDKARAVVDAMERDMGTTLATKQDLEALRRDLATLDLKMTVKLGSMLFVGFGLTIAAMRLWL